VTRIHISADRRSRYLIKQNVLRDRDKTGKVCRNVGSVIEVLGVWNSAGCHAVCSGEGGKKQRRTHSLMAMSLVPSTYHVAFSSRFILLGAYRGNPGEIPPISGSEREQIDMEYSALTPLEQPTWN